MVNRLKSDLENQQVVQDAMARLNRFHVGNGHTKVPFPTLPNLDIVPDTKKEKKKK